MFARSGQRADEDESPPRYVEFAQDHLAVAAAPLPEPATLSLLG
jgi:hypothetical protein